MENTTISACRFASIDFETAGCARGDTDSPIQVGIAHALWGLPLELWDSYIAVDRPVRWAASRVHGITNAVLQGAPSFLSLWPVLKEHLSASVIIGHNLSTEKRFLRTFPGHGFGPWVDTLLLARACLPNLGDYQLCNVVQAMGIQEELDHLLPGKTWHHALYDALACHLVFRSIITALNYHDQPLGVLGCSVSFH